MNNEQVRFASGMNVTLALWLIFSPLILGYAGSAVALWDALNVGVAVLVLASIRLLRPTASTILGWVILLLGAWLAISPFALGLTSVNAVLANNITVGISIAFFSIVGLLITAPTP